DTNAASNAVDENATAGTLVGVTAHAADADATTNAVSYALTDDAGGALQINATNGVVTVLCRTQLDPEREASLNVTVRATSAQLSTADQSFAHTVNDVNPTPRSTALDTNAASNAVDENATAGTLVGVTAHAADADATTNAVSYALTDDA